MSGEAEALRDRVVALEKEVVELRADVARMGRLLGTAGITGFDDWHEAVSRPWRGVEDAAKGRGE